VDVLGDRIVADERKRPFHTRSLTTSSPTRVPSQADEFLRRVRNRKIALVTIPNSHPRIAVTRMIKTSDWRVEPSIQLTLTLPVLATTRAIRITSSATRAAAHLRPRLSSWHQERWLR
jgi:hypothetical protein